MTNFLNHEEINSEVTQALNDSYIYPNRFGFSTIGLHIIPPTGGTIVIEGSYNGSSWFPVFLKDLETSLNIHTVSNAVDVSGTITGYSSIRFRVSLAGSAPGSVVGRAQAQQASSNIDARESGGVSPLNSTSTPLGINETYTGSFESVVGYTNIALSVFSDQNSAVDGLIVEYSSDGINVDSTEVYTLTANKGAQYSFGVLTKWVRIKYVNGTVAQTSFRLQTIYHTYAPKSSSHRIADSITGQNDAELVKSVITGEDPTGVFRNAKVDQDGNIQTVLAALGNNLAYDDMNIDNGGVARGTVITNTWTKLYDSTLAAVPSTSGIVTGVLITVEQFLNSADRSWAFRLVVDGNEVFGANGILGTDLVAVDRYGMDSALTSTVPTWNGFSPKQDTFRWDAPPGLSIKYSQGVQVYVTKLLENKAFRAGLISLTKD